MALSPKDIQEDIEYEKEFTRKNTWANFKMALFGGLSGATFIAALGVVAQKLVGAAEVVGAAASTTAGAATGAAASAGGAGFLGAMFSNPMLTVPILAGMVVVGVAAAYASVAEGTEVKRLQDDRLARQNARAAQLCQEKGVCQSHEYEQNQRADGQKWADVSKQHQTAFAVGH